MLPINVNLLFLLFCDAVAHECQGQECAYKVNSLLQRGVAHSGKVMTRTAVEHEQQAWTGRPLPTGSKCASGVRLVEGLYSLAGLGEHRRGQVISDVEPVENATLRVINMGMGTTATRTNHKAMCKAGIPSIHWRFNCNINERAENLNKKILSMYERLRLCANSMEEISVDVSYKPADMNCSMPHFKAELMSNLRELVASGVMVLADEPYTILMPTLLAMVPDVKLVQTLRDADEWAERRVQAHKMQMGCKENAVHSAASYFDILGCGSPDTKMIGDVITMYKVSDAALAERFSDHNAVFVQASVTSRHGEVRQLCAWDGQYDSEVEDTAALIADIWQAELPPPSHHAWDV